MTAQQLSATLSAVDAVLAAVDTTAKIARVTWRYLKPALILSAAIVIVLGFRCYQVGESFGRWCDRYVAASQQFQSVIDTVPLIMGGEQIAGLLMPAAEITETVGTDLPVWDELQEIWHASGESFEAMTIRELKKFARKAKIKKWDRMTKAQLIAALS